MEDLLSPAETARALGITPGALRSLNLPRVRVGGRIYYREDVIQARARRIAERAVNGLLRSIMPVGPDKPVIWSKWAAAERLCLELEGRCKCGGPAGAGCATCRKAKALKARLTRIRRAA